MENIRLGSRVRDKVNGFEGLVTALTQYLFESDRAFVEAEGLKGTDGRPAEGLWLDTGRLDVIARDGAQTPTATPQTPTPRLVERVVTERSLHELK